MGRRSKKEPVATPQEVAPLSVPAVNLPRLFRVSILIPSTRQSMGALFFADNDGEAREMLNHLFGVNLPNVQVVCDEIPIEKGLVTTEHNNREVFLKYLK